MNWSDSDPQEVYFKTVKLADPDFGKGVPIAIPLYQ